MSNCLCRNNIIPSLGTREFNAFEFRCGREFLFQNSLNIQTTKPLPALPKITCTNTQEKETLSKGLKGTSLLKPMRTGARDSTGCLTTSKQKSIRLCTADQTASVNLLVLKLEIFLHLLESICIPQTFRKILTGAPLPFEIFKSCEFKTHHKDRIPLGDFSR